MWQVLFASRYGKNGPLITQAIIKIINGLLLAKLKAYRL